VRSGTRGGPVTVGEMFWAPTAVRPSRARRLFRVLRASSAASSFREWLFPSAMPATCWPARAVYVEGKDPAAVARVQLLDVESGVVHPSSVGSF
jgi:hypothetical protein